MKTILRIFFIVGIALIWNTGNSDAQLLKKISKGLEKVNKGIEKVNKGLESVDKAVKGNDKKGADGNASSNSSTVTNIPDQKMPSEDNIYTGNIDLEERAQEDDSENTFVGAVYPYVTPNTKILYRDPSIYLRNIITVGEGIFITMENDKMGFWTMDGRCLTDNRFKIPYDEQYLPRFDNGAAIVEENGQYVILYKDGTARRLSKLYNAASQFRDGVATVKEGLGKYYCIDTKGNKIWPHLSQPSCRAMKVGPIRDGLRCVQAIVEISKNSNKNKWGYIDNNGNWVIKPIYEDARDFKNGYALVQEGELMKFIDKKGNTVYQFDEYKYTVNAMNDIGDIYNGYFLYWPFMGRPHFYDLKGNIVQKTYFAATGFNDKGYAFVTFEGPSRDQYALYAINSDFEPVRCYGFLDVGGSWVTLRSPSFGKAGLGTIVEHLVVDEEGNPRIFIPILPSTREMWNCNIGTFVDDYAPCKILADPWEGEFYGFNGFVNTKGEFEVVICNGERNLKMLPGKEVEGKYQVSLTPFNTTPIGPKYIN